MSETNKGWTPGPWMLATSCSWRRFVNRDGESVCEPTTQRDGHPDLHFGHPGNAHLIQAAPDMVEALEMLEDLMTNWEGDFRMEARSLPASFVADAMVKKAKAALARVRGEEPTP